MRFHRFAFLATCLAAAVAESGASLAGEPAASPSGARVLVLADALALARRNGRDLEQSRARLDQAASSVEQAWSALLPQLSLQGKYTHNYKEVSLDFAQFFQPVNALAGLVLPSAAADSFGKMLAGNTPAAPMIQKKEQLDASATLTLPLIVPSAWGALAASRRSHEAAQANTSAVEATVLLATAQSFYAAAGADELLQARRHAVEVARQTADNARARFDAGTVNKVETTRAELALVRAEQALAEADDVRAQAYRALATLCQLREPFTVAPAGPPAEEPPPAEELLGDALQLRPEFRAAEKNVAASAAQSLAAGLRWAPALQGFGQGRVSNYKGFSNDYYAWLVGLQLDWTIYDGGARDAQRHLAEAQRREAASKLAALRDTVADDVYNARRALGTKRRAVETARRSKELSEQTLDLVRAQHDAGTATQLDLLQAQDNLVAAEVGLAQSRFDLALADLSLKRNAGRFPDGGPLPRR